VAYFIGESNLLEGYVINASEKGITAELRGNLRIQSTSNHVQHGEKIVLAIRPEVFEVEKSSRKSKNTLTGTIERVTFEGTTIRYEIRLANQDMIFIIKPSMAEEWFKVGETITVSFPPEKAHVFEYPELGLKGEIAVE
jgi:ABC-type Fe3+/spermidine/putrescine transport system ATPase subunit